MKVSTAISRLSSLVFGASAAILFLFFFSDFFRVDAGAASLMIVWVFIVAVVGYLATLAGALVTRTSGWITLLLVQTVAYLAGAAVLSRSEPWQKEEKDYDKVESAFISRFKAHDLKGMERLLRETPDHQRGRLLGNAPCLAWQNGSLEQLRIAYRLIRKITPAPGASDGQVSCRIMNSALKTGNVDLFRVLVEEGAILSETDMDWLLSESPLYQGLSHESRLALFNVHANVRKYNDPPYDWSSRLSQTFLDPDLSEAVLRYVGGLQGIPDHGAQALFEMVHMAGDGRKDGRKFIPAGVQRLVELGVDVNARHQDLTPLIYAACDRDMVDLLLKNRADPNVLPLSGYQTALNRAIICMAEERSEDLGIVRKLIDSGADVNYSRHDRPASLPPVLQQACEMQGKAQLVKLLKRAGARVDVPDPLGRTSLMTMFDKTPEAVHRLVDCGAEVNARDKAGMTPLRHLVRYEAFDAARALCVYGAEPRSLCSALKAAKDADEMPASLKKLSGHCLEKNHVLQRYRYVLSDGRVFHGLTDANGLTDACDIGNARIVEES